MSPAALDDIDDAIDATRALLWPFDLGRWARLAFVVLFLGGAGAVNPFQFGGNTGTGMPTDPGQPPNVAQVLNSISATEWAIIAGIVAVVLLIALGFGFVGAVMEFVFVESLRRERVSIRKYWGERWRQGVRLLGFRLVVGLLTLGIGGGALVAGLWPLLAGLEGFSFALLAVGFLVFLAVALVGGFVNGLTTQFVVPVMIAEDGGVLAAWRRFWPTLTGEWQEYLVYLVLRFVLGIAIAMVVGIVSVVAAIALAIPVGVVVLVGVALFSVSEILGGVVIAAAVALFVLCLFVVSLFLAVPVQTFLRYYALLVLGDTEAAFDLIADRRREIRGGEPSGTAAAGDKR
jgi:hypothetical protein